MTYEPTDDRSERPAGGASPPTGYWIVLEAPSIHRVERVSDTPVSLCRARHILLALAARMETHPAILGVEPDYRIAETGELCEGLRWRVIECDGVDECSMSAFITAQPPPQDPVHEFDH